MPTPALPATSVTAVLSIVTTFAGASKSSVGVKVAVQTPEPWSATAVSPPFGIVKSSLANPVTTSLNVNVTSEVSPTIRAVSVKTMPTVGSFVSMA